jgi:hypothetical protein
MEHIQRFSSPRTNEALCRGWTQPIWARGFPFHDRESHFPFHEGHQLWRLFLTGFPLAMDEAPLFSAPSNSAARHYLQCRPARGLSSVRGRAVGPRRHPLQGRPGTSSTRRSGCGISRRTRLVLSSIRHQSHTPRRGLSAATCFQNILNPSPEALVSRPAPPPTGRGSRRWGNGPTLKV